MQTTLATGLARDLQNPVVSHRTSGMAETEESVLEAAREGTVGLKSLGGAPQLASRHQQGSHVFKVFE